MVKKVSILAALVLFCTAVFAQQVEFRTLTPPVVEAGVPFRIEFTVNADAEDFVPPDFAGINVIAGPSPSHGQEVTFINGKTTRTVTNSYTYVILLHEEGQITIPSASITVKGKTYTTQPTTIEVVSGGTTPQTEAPSGSGGQQAQPQDPSSAGSLAKDDVVLRIIPSKTTVYKGEPIRVTFKMYTRKPFSNSGNVKYPSFNGFWSQEIPVNDDWKRETYNNKVYEARVLREFILFPQQSGTLSIEQLSMSVVVQLVTQNRAQSLMDEFFGGGQTVQNIPLDLRAGPIAITVKELPAGAPASFQGAVGKFSLSGEPNQVAIPANSAGSYEIKVSGSGNLSTLAQPAIELPTSFEQYTTTTTDAFDIHGNTFSGSKTFTIPFIPRAEGEYSIAPVEFTYFDPDAGRYVTLKTPPYTLTIGKDAGGGGAVSIVSGMNKEDVKLLGEDIRFIRIGNPKLHKEGAVFLGSWGYWLALLLIIALFVATLVYMQKQIKFRNNKTLVRNKRAQKVALKRLKSAEKYMLAKDAAGFYEEMLKALWGYMSDKLNIPVAKLSRDHVKDGLLIRGVEPGLIEQYIGAIAECEYAQYAPSDKTPIGDVYNAAVELISKMESKI